MKKGVEHFIRRSDGFLDQSARWFIHFDNDQRVEGPVILITDIRPHPHNFYQFRLPWWQYVEQKLIEDEWEPIGISEIYLENAKRRYAFSRVFSYTFEVISE